MAPKRVADPPGSAAEAESSPLLTSAERLWRWIGPIFCASTFLAMTVLTWRKWPDVLVDFGRELYVPWRITRGQVLYRDLAALFGPFSQYFNALWFRLFGVSLTTLIFANLAILAGLTWLIYRLLADACDRLTAAVACLTLLLVFAFSQYASTGNYNFICPYAHEATHGLAFSVAMLYCLSRTTARPRLMSALAGLCFGIVLLTKAEVALAAGAALLVWLAASLAISPEGLRPRRVALCFLAGGVALPVLGFFLYFLAQMNAAAALAAVTAAWRALAIPGVTDNIFYRTGLGTDDVSGNVLLALKVFGVIAVPAAVVAAIDWALRKNAVAQGVVGGILGAALIAVIAMQPGSEMWENVARPLPIFAALAWGLSLLALRRRRRDANDARRALIMLSWSTLALVLLAKMILNARIFHYGFSLAMPATLLLVALLLGLVPDLLARGPRRALTFRLVALTAVTAGVVVHVVLFERLNRAKTLVVGPDGDAIVTFPQERDFSGPAVAQTLTLIERSMPPDATFVALPEGVMLNYFSRRVNPTPYINFMPVEMTAFGEPAMLAALQQHPPDFVVLVHKDASEYGLAPFGADPRYGRAIMTWVASGYLPIAIVGDEPLQDPSRFGIAILKRRDASPPAAR